jgi:Signal transduction histidine kinase
LESQSENIPLCFDPDKMEKIICNLISNALKFTLENGEIKLSINNISSGVEISIKDTGIGIPADRLPHIFDRFYQVDNSITREYEGTGIGLALAKELVKLHNGEINVNSREGEGTEFTIYLPFVDLMKDKNIISELSNHNITQEHLDDDIKSSEQELISNDNYSASSIQHQEIILIVEDNPDIQAYVSEQLENEYKVLQAKNGEEGITKAQKEIPDLIITDVMMPKMDGYQFSKAIRGDEKTAIFQ